METKEIVFSVIGAANPVTAELDLLLTTPEGSRVIIITDDQSLMVRAGKVRRDMPNYHEWAALMTEEHKRVVTHHYNSYPMSHNGIPAVNIPQTVFKRVAALQAENKRLRDALAWYAEDMNYLVEKVVYDKHGLPWYAYVAEGDVQERARKALEGGE